MPSASKGGIGVAIHTQAGPWVYRVDKPGELAKGECSHRGAWVLGSAGGLRTAESSGHCRDPCGEAGKHTSP